MLHRILPSLVPRVAPMHSVVWIPWFIIHLIHRFSCTSKHKISYSNKINSSSEGLHVPNLCRFVFYLMAAEYAACLVMILFLPIFSSLTRDVQILRKNESFRSYWRLDQFRALQKHIPAVRQFRDYIFMVYPHIFSKSKVIVVKLILNFLYG